MALKPTLSVTQKQRLAVTQQMQQSVAILGRSNTQLAEFLRQEADDNPLLELTEPTVATAVLGSGQSPDKVILDTVADQETLISGLMRQLSTANIAPSEYFAAEVLIGNLNARGHLDEPLDQIAKSTRFLLADLSAALQIVQGFEPAGVAARNVLECVKLQLRATGQWSDSYAGLMRHIAKGPGNLAKLASALDMPENTVSLMLETIRHLPLDMAEVFAPGSTQHVVPDVLYSTRPDGTISVTLNENAFPKIGLDSAFFDGSLIESASVKKYLDSHRRRINWLTRAMEKRASTILRIAIAASEVQHEFLKQGPLTLKPLKIKQLAAAIKVHESTVGRAISGKFFLCDVGTYPMRFFFSTALSGRGSAVVSATVIRTKIDHMIEAETHENILSDHKITKILAQEGITVARRTVAKYRKSMNVPASSIRRIQKRNILRS